MRSPLAALRSHVELSLSGRIATPFGYRDRKSVETVLTGIPEIDALAGGLPRGRLTEICGPPCSGRTTVLLSALASRTREAEVCALIDACDSFDPRSAEAAGVELQQLLWVRCRNLDQSLRATDLLIQGGGFGFIALDLSDIPPETVRHVPLNAWFRFRRAVEDTATVLVVLEQESNAKTCASLVLQMKMEAARWSTTGNTAGNIATEAVKKSARKAEASKISWHPHTCLLDGYELHADLAHVRIQSSNLPLAVNGPISIASRSAGFAGDVADNLKTFAAQSAWSYLHTLPREAKLK